MIGLIILIIVLILCVVAFYFVKTGDDESTNEKKENSSKDAKHGQAFSDYASINYILYFIAFVIIAIMLITKLF